MVASSFVVCEGAGQRRLCEAARTQGRFLSALYRDRQTGDADTGSPQRTDTCLLSTVPKYTETHFLGRAVAPADSRRLPTAAARVPARVKSCGICDGQSCTGAGSLRVLRYPLPLIHPTNCSTIITICHSGRVQ
jgi:hypothetical protein